MKKSMLAFCLFSLSTLFNTITYAQKTERNKSTDPEIIYLENPSFEDIPSAGRTPHNWLDYGPATETPPDIQPYGGFRVTKAPFHGSSYLGLVTRDHNTWESVGQKLSKAMKKDQCYDFSFVAARSETYESATRHNQKLVNFNKAVTVRIFGANSVGEKTELLATSDLIESPEWQTYKLKFKPTNDYTYIIIEAYYKTPTLFPYNGNVLIDNLSSITPCSITPNDIVSSTPPEPPTPPSNPIKGNPTISTPSTTITPPSTVKIDTTTKAPILPKEDKGTFSTNIKTQDLKVGDIFRLSNLYFAADSTNINRVSENSLMELYTFLKNNPQVIIEIGGHTNGLPTHEYCDKLSAERAQKVADFLITKGIPTSQVQHKGYGKRKPIDTDLTALGRERNQRVEIKILNINK